MYFSYMLANLGLGQIVSVLFIPNFLSLNLLLAYSVYIPVYSMQ